MNGGAGTLLPSEHELGARHGETRNVVRDALTLLRDEGLIERRQGIGTFAVVARPEHSGSRMYFVGEDLDSGAATFETLAVDQLPASERVAERLRVTAGSPLVTVQRRTWLAELPFSLPSLRRGGSDCGWCGSQRRCPTCSQR